MRQSSVFLNRTVALLSTLVMSVSPVLAGEKDKPDERVGNMAPCTSWINPAVKPKVVMLCIHGLGLHSGSYATFAQRMTRFGFAVYAIDVRGFGSWMKAEGHTQLDFDACIDDIKVALQSIRKANPGLPVFLLGESMGGAIALRAASQYPELIDGLISSVPAGERFQSGRTDLKVAGHFLTGPNREFNIGKQVVEQASTDKQNKDVNETLVKDWESDPLARMKLSAKELLQFDMFCRGNHEAAKKVKSMPVLFTQGIDDGLIKPDGTWDLFKKLATPDRTLVALSSTHLIFEESQANSNDVKDSSIFMLLSWVASNMADGKSLLASAIYNNAGPGALAASFSGVDADGKMAILPVPNKPGQGGPPKLPPKVAAALGIPQAAGSDGPPPFAVQNMQVLGQGRRQGQQMAGMMGNRRRPAARRAQRLANKAAQNFMPPPNLVASDSTGGPAGNPASSGDQPQALTNAVNLINQNKYSEAHDILDSFLNANPNNADAHYWNGVVAMKTNHPMVARRSFVNAMRLGRGQGHAREANKYLLDLPTDGSSSPLPADTTGSITAGKPTVLVFYADWAEQCTNIDLLFSKARELFGDKVAFTKIDVAQQSNDQLVKTFDVGPIPTMVFLDRNGKVAQTSIGLSNPVNFMKSVAAIAN
jgi:alpha-beta hydrolase superfamily lysophospholipase/thiol-disulfide isomerase/thioredoxin